jgi:hypothetical protein
MSKPNPRFIDTPETVAIKPIDPTSSKKLTIEDLDIPIDEYLDSLGLSDEPLEEKTKTRSPEKRRSDSSRSRLDSAIDRTIQTYGLLIKHGNAEN